MDAFKGKIYIRIRKPGLNEMQECVCSGAVPGSGWHAACVRGRRHARKGHIFRGNERRVRMSEVMNESVQMACLL